MNYDIRRAGLCDLPALEALYASARAFMARSGNPTQWGTTRPTVQTLREDIGKRQLYVLCTDGKVHGAFAFILGDEPTYAAIDGAWRSDAPYGTLHRVASDGSGGIFTAALEFCAALCLHIRIDTHENNSVMQRRIQAAGFIRTGVIYLEDGSPRIAYERVGE